MDKSKYRLLGGITLSKDGLAQQTLADCPRS